MFRYILQILDKLVIIDPSRRVEKGNRMAVAKYSRTLTDYDGEDSTFQCASEFLSAANMATELTLQSNLGAALNGITRGSLQKIFYGNQVDSNTAPPDDVWAQREIKWKVNYHDAVTGKVRWLTIPTADLTHLDPNNKDRAHIGDGAEVDAFVTAFEAFAKDPDTGNAVVVDSIVPIGVNL